MKKSGKKFQGTWEKVVFETRFLHKLRYHWQEFSNFGNIKMIAVGLAFIPE